MASAVRGGFLITTLAAASNLMAAGAAARPGLRAGGVAPDFLAFLVIRRNRRGSQPAVGVARGIRMWRIRFALWWR